MNQFIKTLTIIDSCKTNEQLTVANNYLLRAYETNKISYEQTLELWSHLSKKWIGNDSPPPPFER